MDVSLPNGVGTSVFIPDLMLGIAGLGHFLMRLIIINYPLCFAWLPIIFIALNLNPPKESNWAHVTQAQI